MVQEGDTVYGIAQRYDVPLRDLIEANNLGPPFIVRTGQVLRLPASREHIVQYADTLSEIAERHGLTTADLAALNGIEPPYTIYAGQALRLPGPSAPPGPAPVATAEPAPPSGAVGAPVSLAPNPGPVDREVLAAPQPAPPGDIAASAEAPPPTTIAVAPPTDAEPPAFSLDDGSRQAGLPADVAPPPRAGSTFQWPVRGQVLAGFGEATDSGRNEGVNIAAPRGTPILAAENGVVAYAGNELRGYGNLLLIRHAGGWVTAYAHTDEILVTRGEQVRIGQTVATVGDTGAVSGPQLHFEIRQGSESVDPLDHLP